MDNEEVLRLLDVTKINLLTKKGSTFLTTILFSLKLKIGHEVPTAAVNITTMYINPDFFLSLNQNEREFLLAHEAWHVAFRHVHNEQLLDDERLNKAGDYAINNMLTNCGYDTPQGGLLNHDWDHLSTYEIYRELENDQSQDNKQDQGIGSDIMPNEDPSGSGDSNEEGGMTPEQVAQAHSNKLDTLLAKAHVQTRNIEGSKGVGNIPGEIERYIADLFDPKVPWQNLLQNYFSSFNKDDYSMRRPNRRFMPDFYLPSLYSESMGEIAFMCDSSGSVGPDEFKQFFSEGSYVKTVMNPEKFTITSFDTNIRSEYTFAKEEELGSPKLEGGGGTRIGPVIKWLNDHKPEIAVIFTDGYFHFPDEQYKGELIWLIRDNPTFTSEFGRVIHFN